MLSADSATAQGEGTGVSIISTFVTGPITLASAVYAESLSITSAGTVASYGFNPGVSGDGTLVNAGIIHADGLQGIGVHITSGTVINSGSISAETGISAQYGTIINNGFIGGNGGIFFDNGVVIDSGQVRGLDASGITAQFGLTLVLEAGFQIGGEGNDAQSADVKSGNGTLILTSGIQNIALYGFEGFSNINVGAEIGVTITANEGWLEGLPSGVTTLSGFQGVDTLVIPSSYPATYVSGEGIVISDVLYGAGAVTIALETPPTFGLTFSPAGNYVEITAPCFCAGTRIRTPRGDIPVEDLAVGDEVMTAFAGVQRIKWIGWRGYEGRLIAGNRDALPVCIKAGAIAKGIPLRDLWVSPDHAICEGGVLIHAWRLINGVSIVQAEAVHHVKYFHIELEAHEVLFAEDCATESFLDTGCRQRFANIGEYSTLEDEAAKAEFCLPLLQSGFHLENIRRRLAERAGLPTGNVPLGPLRGCLDEAGPELLRGWAQDLSAPEHPVSLSIMVDGRPLALVLANEFRADLRAAGLGSGCHAFSLPFPRDATQIEIRRASDGILLGCSTITRAA